MAEEETFKTVGYIRSNCFSKVMGLFEEERITAFEATRSKKEDYSKEVYKDWISERVDTLKTYIVKWDHWTMGATFELEKVRVLVRKLGLGDMVVQTVEFEFVEPKVARLINEELERIAYERGKQKEDIIYLPEVVRLYATFRNNNSQELRSLQFVKHLNFDAHQRYHFKTGVLDLVHLETERAKNYGEREDIPVFDWPDIARLVLSHLNPDGWPRDDRRVEILGEVSYPKPFAMRRYRASTKKGWALIGEEEV